MIIVSNYFKVFVINLSLLGILFYCDVSCAKENEYEMVYLSSIKNISNTIPVMSDLKLPNDADIKFNPNNQTIIFLKAKNLSLIMEKDDNFRKLILSEKFGEAAINFIADYRSFFKLINPKKELIIKSTKKDDIGYKHVHLSQMFSNIPIWSAELIVHFDKDDHVYLVNGRYVPTPVKLKTQPTLSKQDIKRLITKEFSQIKSECKDCKINLVIFNDHTNTPHLAYHVFASVSLMEGWEIIVDAETGGILQKTPTVYH